MASCNWHECLTLCPNAIALIVNWMVGSIQMRIYSWVYRYVIKGKKRSCQLFVYLFNCWYMHLLSLPLLGFLTIVVLTKPWKCYFDYHLALCLLGRPQIYTRDPRPPIPPCVMALSTMGAQFGGLRFLPTTHAKINAKQMRSQSSRAVQYFALVCLHAQTPVHADNIRTWHTPTVFITEKTWRPPNSAGVKMAQVLRSLVYIFGLY